MRRIFEIEVEHSPQMTDGQLSALGDELAVYAEEKVGVYGADVLDEIDPDWVDADDRHASLLDHAVNVMFQNNVDWYMKYHGTMRIWRSVLACFVNSANEHVFDHLFEEWMKESGFLDDARRRMSTGELKALGIEK